MDNNSSSDIEDVRVKLDEIHRDIKSFIEDSNREHLESMLAFVKSDYSNVLEKHLIDDMKIGLSNNMVPKCDNREKCRRALTDILQKNASLIKQPSIDDESIENNRTELTELREQVPYDKCNICLSEGSALFEKQVTLMQSLRIYEANKDQKQDISAIPSQSVTSTIIDPLCHPKRFEILKAVYYQTMSFTSLSKLVGVRGGNLLFHLQKLLDSGMIIQQHERNDYMITKKGVKVMEGINEIYASLIPEENEST